MRYQGRPNEWFGSVAWNQMINTLLIWCPVLFDCRRVTLEKFAGKRAFEDLSAILQKLGAVQVAEARGEAAEGDQYFFRVQGKPIALIVVPNKPPKIIAPQSSIEFIQNEVKVVLP